MPMLLHSLLQITHATTQTKICKRECKPSHTTLQVQLSAKLKLMCLERTAARTDNIKIKRNKKKKGFER